MDAAKQAVSSFLAGSGGHKTEVEEQQLPAVTRETIQPQRHEISTQAVDRELHRHHYHTTVQPIDHKETLPEKHSHNPVAIEHREFRHEDPKVGRDTHMANLARFKPSATTHETKHTSTNNPDVTGEHFVHHVHERVQPVIYKDVHRPEVVHTVQQIHEVHQAPSEHHGISLLPERTVDQLRAHGIDLEHGSSGIAHHKQDYEGHPRSYNPKYQLTRNPIDLEPEKHYGLHDLEGTGHPYESKFESALAEPLTTAFGYKSGFSKMGAEPLKTEPGKSALGYSIEENRVASEREGMSPLSVSEAAARSPTAASATKSRDFATGAQRVGTHESLDPRSHWSATDDTAAAQNVEAPNKTASAGKAEPRERPDSGISIPDRTASRGKTSLDESLTQSTTTETKTTTTTRVPTNAPTTTTTTTEGPTTTLGSQAAQ